MQQIIQNLKSVIFRTAEHEDRELNVICDKGLFFMPELAFAYIVGKEIAKNREQIFGEAGYEWSRENTLEEYGLATVIFESKDAAKSSILIQFKMRDTYLSYINDIKDLRKQEVGKYRKLFCAVVEVFEQQHDAYFRSLKEAFGSEATLIGTTRPFYTWSDKYKQQIVYIIGLWDVQPDGEGETSSAVSLDHGDVHYLDTSI